MKLPQFSLRELFLLVALVAMGCGWWVRERQLRTELGEAGRWRGRAVLKDNGRAVKWKQKQVQVESGHGWDAYSTTLIPPPDDVDESE